MDDYGFVDYYAQLLDGMDEEQWEAMRLEAERDRADWEKNIDEVAVANEGQYIQKQIDLPF